MVTSKLLHKIMGIEGLYYISGILGIEYGGFRVLRVVGRFRWGFRGFRFEG